MAMIDYKMLLEKYVRYVRVVEGSHFVYDEDRSYGKRDDGRSTFTQEEWRELERISARAEQRE